MSKVLCIVAGQRAGTTALHNALRADGRFRNFGEIFQNAEMPREGGFVDFVADNNIGFDGFITSAKCRDVAKRYLSHLRQLSGAKIPLIDIKYNSWNVLKPLWSYPTDQPFFLKILKEEKTAFLMILRERLWDQIVSEEIARKTSVWHNLKTEHVQDVQMRLDLEMVRLKARRILETEALLFEHLKPVQSAKFVKYENLYTADGYSKKMMTFLGRQFGLEFAGGLSGGMRKNEGKKRDIILNYNRVASVVKEQIDMAGGRVF